MKVYRKENSHLYCGHWNGSPVEIGITELLNAPPRSETLHYHEYYEYYVVLQGKGKLNVEGTDVDLKSNTVIMIEPHEKHKVTWVDPVKEIQWLIIKQKSLPNSKIIVSKNDKV